MFDTAILLVQRFLVLGELSLGNGETFARLR